MLKVAITGNIASGKSVAEDIIRKQNLPVLDTDIVAHELLNNPNVKKQIITTFFGHDILDGQEISREKLGKIVFANPVFKKKIEMIMHPLIKQEIGHFFLNQEKALEKVAFVSVPLLFEANFYPLFDKIIMIYAKDEIRFERLLKRNPDRSEADLKNKMSAQMSQDEKINRVDYILYNNTSLEEYSSEVLKTLAELNRL